MQEILKQREEIYDRAKKKVLEKAEELGLSENNALVLNEIALIISKMDVEEEIPGLSPT